jgi:hypothetical protein
VGPVAAAAGAAGEPLPTPQFGAGEIRDRADEILAGRAYQEPEPSIVTRALNWVVEQLRRLQPDLPNGSLPQGDGSDVVGWIAMLALLALVVFLISRWRRLGRRRRGEDPLVLTEAEARRLPDEWVAEAERHEAAGRWRDALRCRFRALVGELIERGVARDLPGRTTGELRRDVRRRAPDATVAFEEAAALFDDAWYGDRATGPEENARFRALAAVVLAAPVPRRSDGPERPPEPAAAAGNAPERSP